MNYIKLRERQWRISVISVRHFFFFLFNCEKEYYYFSRHFTMIKVFIILLLYFGVQCTFMYITVVQQQHNRVLRALQHQWGRIITFEKKQRYLSKRYNFRVLLLNIGICMYMRIKKLNKNVLHAGAFQKYSIWSYITYLRRRQLPSNFKNI